MYKLGYFLVFSLFIAACGELDISNQQEPAALINEGYVGSINCLECHQQAYSDWQGSHHDWAMQLPNDTTVLGDFNNVDFRADSVEYHFFKKDSSYFVRTTGDDGQVKDFEIAYTFGVKPLQQYLIQFPDGKYQTLRATWDTEKKVWYNQYGGQVIPHDDWLHWTQGGQRWNTMCAECHSTNLQKGYNISKDLFNTTYSEINVSCESCHGPGQRHVEWARGDTTGYPSAVAMLGSTQQQQVNMCAGCHARRVKLTDVMKPNTEFADQFLVQVINDEYYHADGQILEEDYVMGSFMQSKMFKEGVKCSDCHNVHSMEVRTQGNALCLQCHIPNQYETPEHHFHKMGTEQSLCVSCHMTGDVYMGNDFRRDHSFRVPRPDQSVEFDTPNACTGCHKEKTDEWAAEWIVEWYGTERADHFSDKLLLASQEIYDESTTNEVLSFINDLKYPAIARATALEYFPISGNQAVFNMIDRALADSSSLVRYHALNKLGSFPIDQVAGAAIEMTKDTTRLVRIAAARLLVELDVNQLPAIERNSVVRANMELEEMLRANADFPIGRMQLGDYYLRKGLTRKAITEYEKAIEMDRLTTAVYGNLATAYNLVGDNQSAIDALNVLIELEPDYGRGFYLRGLLKNEMGDVDGALADLEQATLKDGQNFRGWYNYANLLKQNEDPDRAERAMLSGLALQPDSPEGLYLLALIYQDQGREQEAQAIMQQLQSMRN